MVEKMVEASVLTEAVGGLDGGWVFLLLPV